MDAGLKPRGRPKDAAVEKRMLDAAIDLLIEVGFSGLTVDKITAHAGIPRSTFYRRWQTVNEVVIAAIRDVYADTYPTPPDTGDVITDLRQMVRAMAKLVADRRLGRVFRFLIAEMAVDADLRAATMEIVRQRRAIATAVLQRGIDKGQLRANTNAPMLIEVISGAMFFHQFFGETEIDEAYVDGVATLVLEGALNSASSSAESSNAAAASTTRAE
ncbi:MAG: TetR/AcrR family transcriptional regulator [Sphingobium sp.]